MRYAVLAMLAVAVFALSSATVYAGESVKLSPPRTDGGDSVLKAIDKRASGSTFAGAVSEPELSTILWAATGRNRDNGGWTVPMAMGKPPYVKVYVVGKDGAFLYDWENHALVKIVSKDIRPDIGMQGFVKNSYYNLLVTSDDAALKALNPGLARELGGYAVGAVTQNIYLASAALGVKTRFIMSVNKDVAVDLLGLENETPHCIMTLGK